jgi:ATP dependent DNA ligase domain
VSRLAFIRPLSPSAAVRPPKGDDLLHEPKWDGFRFQVIKDGSDIRLYSRHGAEYTERLPRMAEAFAKLPTQSVILDGELVLIDPRGAAHFYRLMAQMRTSSPDESQLMFLAFDLLHQDGVDLRSLTLIQRKKYLDRLCRSARIPFLRLVETFPDGEVLLGLLQPFWVRGHRVEATDIRLRQRGKPPLGQGEVSRLEARQRASSQTFRGQQEARVDGGSEGADQEATGTRPRSGAPAGTGFAPRHCSRATEAPGHS